MKYKKYLIFIVVLLMAVGFAAITVTLNITGLIGIGNNLDDFKVAFTNTILDGEEITDTSLNPDGKVMKYNTSNLRFNGDNSVMEFVISNDSYQYDANIVLNCDELDADYANIEINLDEKKITARESVSGTIKVALQSDYIDTENGVSFEMTCRLNIAALERTSIAEDNNSENFTTKKYVEPILNGTDPVLTSELIPVIISEDGTLTYADINKKWYKYGDKEWANAVILKSTKEYEVGSVIKEEDIESYFVWVPRFKYELWNVNQGDELLENEPSNSNAKMINIEFESKETNPSKGTKNGEYLTHPAFINLDVNGFWVGKFETGYEGATKKEEAQVNEISTNKIIIKPNVYSWRGINLANIFKVSYEYKRAMDSHMMKNTEWGAVTYLAHSRYGINLETNINNNSDYKTGYGASLDTDQGNYPGIYGTTDELTQAYNTTTGGKASTTGNITGIYDMKGGASEYVAAYKSGNVNSDLFNESDLETYKKYFDLYDEESTISSYSKRILGDATGELGSFYNAKLGEDDSTLKVYNSWYSDLSYFVNSENSWFHRGGNYSEGILAGAFNFNVADGQANNDIGYRIVLSIK